MTSMDLTDRIRNQLFFGKIMSADEAATLISPKDKVAISGFTPSGYPKAVPLALAKRIEKEHFQVELWTGASVGDEVDGALARVNGIRSRLPYQTNNDLRKQINSGEVGYLDQHLSHVASQLRMGFYGRPDIVIIEAAAITPEGNIIPTTSVGNSPVYVNQCSRVIVEINTTQPLFLEGMHDIYEPAAAPDCQPIPIIGAGDRIGTTYIPCSSEKIVAIVICDIPDKPRALKKIDQDSQTMSEYLIEFFENEIKQGRMPKNLRPLQSGVGSVANAVLSGLDKGPFEHLTFYSEVMQDSMLTLLENGKVDFISSTALSLTPESLQRFYKNIERYKSHVVLRPEEISNNPEVIRRLGVISMNTAIEFDIYGNVNSSHICGTKMMNGIGGAGDFTRNAGLSIFCTTSTAKNGAISSIVPMCSHVDHTEHDVHVFCTEQGLADVRGLSPKEKAKVIIDHCAHPDYKDMLFDYLERAIALTHGNHTPHILNEALSWHERFLDSGTMKMNR